MTGDEALEVLRSETAGAWVFVALRRQREWLRINGFDVPDELEELMQFCADARLSRQDPTRLVEPLPARETSRRTTTSTGLLTKQRAAEELGLSVRTVERLMKAGDLPPVYVTRRTPRFRPDDIENFRRDRRMQRSWQAAG